MQWLSTSCARGMTRASCAKRSKAAASSRRVLSPVFTVISSPQALLCVRLAFPARRARPPPPRPSPGQPLKRYGACCLRFQTKTAEAHAYTQTCARKHTNTFPFILQEDNDGGMVEIEQIEGPTSGSEFPIGTTPVSAAHTAAKLSLSVLASLLRLKSG